MTAPTLEATKIPEACAATPREDLERQIMDPNVPKNEREWWAAREIEKLRERSQWQPIETAPKDSSGCFDQACHIGFVAWGNNSKHVGPIIWQGDEYGWEFTETSFDMFPAPTHWQPLPAPPKAEA